MAKILRFEGDDHNTQMEIANQSAPYFFNETLRNKTMAVDYVITSLGNNGAGLAAIITDGTLIHADATMRLSIVSDYDAAVQAELDGADVETLTVTKVGDRYEVTDEASNYLAATAFNDANRKAFASQGHFVQALVTGALESLFPDCVAMVVSQANSKVYLVDDDTDLGTEDIAMGAAAIALEMDMGSINAGSGFFE